MDGPAYGAAAAECDRKRRAVRAKEAEPAEAADEALERLTSRNPGPCLARSVGTSNGTYYSFDRLGQFRMLGVQMLGQSPQVLAPFGGIAGTGWLRNKFPDFDRNGDWTKGFQIRGYNAWLIDECTRAGLFDPDKLPIRGHGL